MEGMTAPLRSFPTAAGIKSAAFWRSLELVLLQMGYQVYSRNPYRSGAEPGALHHWASAGDRTTQPVRRAPISPLLYSAKRTSDSPRPSIQAGAEPL